MNKVRIDFAPRSLPRAVFRAPRITWSLLLGAAVLAPFVASTGLKVRDLQRVQERRVAAVEARTRAALPAAAPARPPVPAAQATAVNAAVRQLNLPWRGLHDAIQAATPATIALLALEPDAKKRSVRITAETKSADDMIAYVGQLRAVEWFSDVALVRHEINEQDPNRPIRFQLDAQWKAAP